MPRPKPISPDEALSATPWNFPSFGNHRRLHPIRSAQAVEEEDAQRRRAQQATARRLALLQRQDAARAQAAAVPSPETQPSSAPMGPTLTAEQRARIQAHQEGFSKGYNAGAQQGRAEGRAQVQGTTARLQALVQGFEAALHEVAERTDAERMAPGGGPRSTSGLTLWVATTDLVIARRHLAPGLVPLGWSLAADPSLAEGRCAIRPTVESASMAAPRPTPA